MNLGYYFHPRAVFDDDGVAKTEAHWGYFVRALAQEVGEVTFYAHPGADGGTETLPLRPQDNVRCVDIGPRRQNPLMHFFPGPSLVRFRPQDDGLDAMLVRAPTPLLPGIARRCERDGVPMVVLLVDDTTNWRSTEAFPWWRNRAILSFLWVARRSQDRVARRHLMLAIAPSILRRRSYKRKAVVPTTSLRRADLTGPAGRARPFPAANERIRLLYTGRFFEEKGLLEFTDAVKLLVDRGHNVELELVGAAYGDTTIEVLRQRADAHGIRERIIESGFLEAGPELLAAYDHADVFVSPTWGEGSVTRTIKEAFARGLPVVTTTIRENTQFLQDGVHAVLVPVRDAVGLADGIERVIKDSAFRAGMTAAGFEWVQDYTNEHSAELVAGHVRDEIAAADAEVAGPDVLVLSPHLAPPPGGIQRLAMDIADALGDQQVRVVGVSDEHSSDPRLRVVRQQRGRVGSILTNLAYARAVVSELRQRPRVVHAMTWRAALPALLLRRAPMALYCHGGELIRGGAGPNARLRSFVLRRTDVIVANSEFTAGLVRDGAGRDAIVIHPPVGAVPADVPSRTGRDGVAVLSVGRLVKNKGHDRLLRAVAEVRATGLALSVTIVGGGPEHDHLAALIDELGLADAATLAGAVSDDELAQHYRDADIFTLLSVPVDGEVEGFGIVFLEANSYGLPVVAGRSGGTQEAVADGGSGVVADGHDEAVAALAKLATDPALRQRLGAGGRDRLKDFTLVRFGEQLRSVYARL